MKMDAQLIALQDGSTERFFNVHAPRSINDLTFGISAFGMVYDPQPSRPMKMMCSGWFEAFAAVAAEMISSRIRKIFFMISRFLIGGF